jgi:hypothetical protein
MTKKQQRDNYIIVGYENGVAIKQYPPEDIPESTWIKDYALHSAKTRIPEDAQESGLFTKFTRKNQA